MSFRKILSDTFTKADKSAWLKAASAEINGNNPIESLRWQTADGITFNAYYDQTDVANLQQLQHFHFYDSNCWTAISPVTVIDEVSANKLALQHLKNEADGIIFSLEKEKIDFNVLLTEIEWPYCSISFIISHHTQVEQLQKYIKINYHQSDLPGVLFWTNTNLIGPFPTINKFKSAGIYITPSTPVEEIANALVKAVQLIYQIQSTGLERKSIVDNIAFYLPVENNFLTEISKLKALRMLWYQVTQTLEIKNYLPEHLHIHTRSEIYLNEFYEPHGNMLSNTVSSMAAICGGCNAHTVYPEKENDNMLSRVARNNAHILRDEAHFNKVADPLAGSYVIENMVKEIAQTAWKKFQLTIDQQI